MMALCILKHFAGPNGNSGVGQKSPNGCDIDIQLEAGQARHVGGAVYEGCGLGGTLNSDAHYTHFI